MLFDFGGSCRVLQAFNRYEAEVGLPLGMIRRINATNPTTTWRLERGIPAARFVEAFEGEANDRLRGRRLEYAACGVIRPAMAEVLRRCSANFGRR